MPTSTVTCSLLKRTERKAANATAHPSTLKLSVLQAVHPAPLLTLCLAITQLINALFTYNKLVE